MQDVAQIKIKASIPAEGVCLCVCICCLQIPTRSYLFLVPSCVPTADFSNPDAFGRRKLLVPTPEKGHV